MSQRNFIASLYVQKLMSLSEVCTCPIRSYVIIIIILQLWAAGNISPQCTAGHHVDPEEDGGARQGLCQAVLRGGALKEGQTALVVGTLDNASAGRCVKDNAFGLQGTSLFILKNDIWSVWECQKCKVNGMAWIYEICLPMVQRGTQATLYVQPNQQQINCNTKPKMTIVWGKRIFCSSWSSHKRESNYIARISTWRERYFCCTVLSGHKKTPSIFMFLSWRPEVMLDLNVFRPDGAMAFRTIATWSRWLSPRKL